MRRYILAGNWKMYTDLNSAKALAQGLVKAVGETDRDVVLIPPYPFIESVAAAVAGSAVDVGAQEIRAENEGAYTGDVSAAMVKSVGAKYGVVGHSERRQYYGETSGACNAKIRSLLAAGLTPIYCIGEKLEVREAGGTLDLIETQVREGLDGLDASDVGKMVLAYEPVWAIGTGKVATPDQAQEVHAFIRKILGELYDADLAQKVRIQYGGSVKPDNVDELMACPDIDGALVGGASLKVDSFARIVQFK